MKHNPNHNTILCGIVGLVIGAGFGLLIQSILLATGTGIIVGLAIGGIIDVRREFPPDPDSAC